MTSYISTLNSLLTSTTSRYNSLRRNILSSSSEDDTVLLPLLLTPPPYIPFHHLSPSLPHIPLTILLSKPPRPPSLSISKLPQYHSPPHLFHNLTQPQSIDNPDSTHVSRVLRAYYTEKSLPLPLWLPPDPRAPPPVSTPALTTRPIGSLRSRTSDSRSGSTLPPSTGGGLGDLWDSPTSSHPEEGGLRRAAIGRRAGVVAARGESPYRSTGNSMDGDGRGGARPLPSQRAGSYQVQSQANRYEEGSGGGRYDGGYGGRESPAPPGSSGGGGSAQERLKARLNRGGGSGRSTPDANFGGGGGGDYMDGGGRYASGGGGGGGGGENRYGSRDDRGQAGGRYGR